MTLKGQAERVECDVVLGWGREWNQRDKVQLGCRCCELTGVQGSSMADLWGRGEKYLTGRPRLKCHGTRAETRFRLSAKRTSPFKSAGASVQWTAGSRGVRISGSNAGYSMFRGSVKSTGYPLHSPVSTSLSLPCVAVWHHISTGV